jgi:hypothetical protein
MNLLTCMLVPSLLGCAWVLVAERTAWAADDSIALKVALVKDEDGDPAAAGRSAAEQLKKAMGPAPLKLVLVSECFENRDNKEKLLAGVASVLPKGIVLGGATYGSFTQAGCADFDSVGLLGVGGPGINVSTALVTELGTAKLTPGKDDDQIRTRLHAAGESLAKKLARSPQDKLLILVADAHSPKNQFLVEGVQKVLGGDFPITGGCANKNAGQTFVYYGGQAHADSAVAVLLSGDFRVSLAGRQANQNERVIATAQQGAAEVMKNAQGKPVAVLAFNCAGRRSKLKKYEDELAAIQKALGRDLPLFGCYCAGEIGPLDVPPQDKKPGVLSGGAGWHVMFTVISK